ncbi:MAG: type II toxin-antitoxin system VapC family toxin [Deltaproteobacteria bacterium]|nr:type II toxin-antitoxin system VapC family toxin [Deltaproteobacteria bacterium]
MNLLLDTHVLLWWLEDNPTLSPKARDAVAEGRNMVFVSAASIWEIRIKQALRKLRLPRNFREVLDSQPFRALPVTWEHAHAVHELPDHHRDPFDRMLVAQAKVERLAIVTRDERIKKYAVTVIEA